MSWILLAIWGCVETPETGPDWMVGRVTSAAGAPVKDLEVASLEASDRTDDDGAFAVRYKDPSRHVHFGHGGVWYQRDYRPDDLGVEVAIALPPLRDLTLRCGPEPCVVSLAWDLDDGFGAKAIQACEPGLEVALRQVPASRPDGLCTEGTTGPKVDVSVEDHGSILKIGAAKRAVRVQIRAVDAAPPESCEIAIGDRVARPAGDGFWSAEVSGVVTVSGTCDGWPARPRQVGAEVGSVTLEWTGAGLVLDLEEIAPWLTSLQLVAEQGESAGWMAQLTESADGTFALPPLSVGRYRVLGSGVPDPALLAEQPPIPSAAGILAVRVVAGAEQLVGRLDATGDLVTGSLPVERHEVAQRPSAPSDQR